MGLQEEVSLDELEQSPLPVADELRHPPKVVKLQHRQSDKEKKKRSVAIEEGLRRVDRSPK
jgi:hypothetical protein